MLFLSVLGNAYFVVMFIAVLFFILPDDIKILTESSMITSFFISTSIVFILKFTVRRRRISKGDDRFINNYDPYSFPSGHASRVAALAIPMQFISSILSAVVILIAVIVSFSRISKGYHYISDCLCGIAVGVVSGMIAVGLSDISTQFLYFLISLIKIN